MNMIYKVVEDASLQAEVAAFASYIATMPTKAMGLTKRAVNASFSNDLETQLALEEVLQTEAGESYDFKEGVSSFLQKRKPEFKGN